MVKPINSRSLNKLLGKEFKVSATKLYKTFREFTRLLHIRIKQMPKEYKWSYGESLSTKSMEIMDRITKLYDNKDKKTDFEWLLADLRELSDRLCISISLGLIRGKSAVELIKLLECAKAQVLAWQKSYHQKALESVATV